MNQARPSKTARCDQCGTEVPAAELRRQVITAGGWTSPGYLGKDMPAAGLFWKFGFVCARCAAARGRWWLIARLSIIAALALFALSWILKYQEQMITLPR